MCICAVVSRGIAPLSIERGTEEAEGKDERASEGGEKRTGLLAFASEGAMVKLTGADLVGGVVDNANAPPGTNNALTNGLDKALDVGKEADAGAETVRVTLPDDAETGPGIVTGLVVAAVDITLWCCKKHTGFQIEITSSTWYSHIHSTSKQCAAS